MDADPENPQACIDRANVTYDLGLALGYSGRLNDAVQQIENAQNEFESLAKKFPSRMECSEMSATCNDGRATTLKIMKRYKSAQA